MSIPDSLSLNFAAFWYDWGERLVIFGVCLEGFEIFWRRVWMPIANKNRKSVTEPWLSLATSRNEPRWLKTIGDFGWFILTLGLVISLLAHFRITGITSRENIRLTKQLDATTKSAGEANERTSSNEVHFAELTQSNLLLQIALNETRSDWIKSELPMSLRRKAGPFSIPRIAFHELRSTPSTNIILVVNANDPNAAYTANDLQTAFGFAGWTNLEIRLKPVITRGIYIGVDGWDYQFFPEIALGFRYRDYPTADIAAQLLKIFGKEGLPIKISDIPKDVSCPTNAILIVVGQNLDAISAEEIHLEGIWQSLRYEKMSVQRYVDSHIPEGFSGTYQYDADDQIYMKTNYDRITQEDLELDEKRTKLYKKEKDFERFLQDTN